MEKIIALRIKVADKQEAIKAIKPINVELVKTGKLLNAQIASYKKIIGLQKQAASAAAAGASAGTANAPRRPASSGGGRARAGASVNLDSSAALRRQAIDARAAGVEIDVLVKRIATLKQRQSEVNEEVKEQNRLFNEAKFAAGSYRAINAEVGRLSASYRDASDAERNGVAGQKTLKRIKELRGDLKRIDADMGIYVRNVGNYGSAFNRIGGVVSRLVALGGISLGASEIVREAAQISDSIANVQKVSGLAQAEVRKLANELKLRDTRTSLEDQLGIAEVGGRLGLNESNLGTEEATRQLVEFTDAIDTANVALGDQFNDDAEQVASTLAGLRNVLIDFRPNGDADIGGDLLRIGNALNFLETQGNSTAPVIADFVNRIGGGAVPLGATTESIFALSTTLDELEVSAERGATAVTKSLTDIAANPEKFAGIVVESGLIESGEAFTKLVNEDIVTALTLVAQAAGDTTETNTEFAQTLEAFGITGTRAIEVFGKLSGSGERYNELLGISAKSLSETTSLTEEFEAKNSTLGAELDKLKNNLIEAYVSDEIQDGLKTIIQGAGRFLTALLALPSVIKENRVALFFLIAGIATFNGQLILSQAALLRQAIATKRTAISQWLLNTALNANPIGIVITAVLLLIGALTGLYNNSETVRNAIDSAIESFRRMYSESLLLKTVLGPVGLAFKLLADIFAEGPGVIFAYIDAIKTFASNIPPNVEIVRLKFVQLGLTIAEALTFGAANRRLKRDLDDVAELIANQQGIIESNDAAFDQREIDRKKAKVKLLKDQQAEAAAAEIAKDEETQDKLNAAELEALEKRRKERAKVLKAQREQEAKDRLAAAKRILDLENELIFNRFDRQEAQATTASERDIAGLVGDPEQIERQAELIRKKLTIELGKINTARTEAQGEALALVKQYGEELRDARIANGTNEAKAELDRLEDFFTLQEKALSTQLAQQNAVLLKSFRAGEIGYNEFNKRRAELGKLTKQQLVTLAGQELIEVTAADAKLTDQLLVQAQARFNALKAQRIAEKAERDAELQGEFEEGDIGIDGLSEGLDNSEQLRREQELEDLRAFEEQKAELATDFAIRGLERAEKAADNEVAVSRRAAREIAKLEEKKRDAILAGSEAIGSAVSNFFTGQIATFKDFQKQILIIALEALEKIALLSIAQATVKEIGTKGFIGIGTAAVLTGLIKGATTGLKAAVNSFEDGGVMVGDSGPWKGGHVPDGSGMITGRSHWNGGIRRGNNEVQRGEFKIQNGSEHYIVNRDSTARYLPALQRLAASPGVFSPMRRAQVSAINSAGGLGRSFEGGGVLIGSQPLAAPITPGIVQSNTDAGLSSQDAALLIELNQRALMASESAMNLAAEVSGRIDRVQVTINAGDALRAGQDQIEIEGREGL